MLIAPSLLSCDFARFADEIIRAVREVVEYLRNMSPFWRDLVDGKRRHVFEK